MNLQTFTLLLPAFLFISFAFFIYFKGQNSRINRMFILFVLNMAMWSLSIAVFYTVKTPQAITFWSKMVYVLASFIPPFFVLFSFVFPDGRNRLSLLNKSLLFLPSVLLGIIYFTSSLIIKSAFVKDGVRGFEYGPLRLLWDIQYKGIFAIGFYRFLCLYKGNQGIIREKIKYILIANLYLCILGGMPHVILPVFKIFNFFWMGPLFSLVWLVIIVFAIVKYRLVDVRVGFSNMGIFAGTYVFVLGIPICLFFSDHKFMALILSLFLATIGPFMYLRFKKMAEDKILEEEKRYQNALLAASKAIRLLKNQEKIVHLLSNLLFKAMKLNHLSIYIKENDQYVLKDWRGGEAWKAIPIVPGLIEILQLQGTFIVEELEFQVSQKNISSDTILHDLEQREVKVVVPILSDHDIIGLILIGDKNNHVVFSNRDIFVFNILADYAGLALKNMG